MFETKLEIHAQYGVGYLHKVKMMSVVACRVWFALYRSKLAEGLVESNPLRLTFLFKLCGWDIVLYLCRC